MWVEEEGGDRNLPGRGTLQEAGDGHALSQCLAWILKCICAVALGRLGLEHGLLLQ